MTASIYETYAQPRASIAQVVEQFGGIEALAARMAEHERLTARMQSEIESLPDITSDKWFAMGRDEVLEVGDSLEEVVSNLKARGMAGDSAVVKLLTANPEVMIL